MRFEIHRQDGDLNRLVWVFTLVCDYGPVRLILESWERQQRPTKRHKWRIAECWYRLSHRAQRQIDGDPTVPDDVIAEAREKLKTEIDNLNYQLKY